MWATAVVSAGRRFTALLRHPAAGTAMATADWSVADTAAHVLTLAQVYRSLLGRLDPPAPHVADEILDVVTVDTVADFNEILLAQIGTREPVRLAGLLEAEFARMTEAAAGRDPAATVPWLGGSNVPVAGLFGHLVNELHIHGRDIARALGEPWTIPAPEAALFFELFLLGVIREGYGTLVDGVTLRDPARIAVEFHSAHTTPVTVTLTDDVVSWEPAGGRVDVRVRFDPPTLNLMLFGRLSRARAVAGGGIRIGGPRPWKILPFLRKLRMPH
ncbi:maleylpyruvate isomerase N-terminal domain-containing protein [Dactylosporangium sp. CS-033363]|uniref:maleylpyruvate isomerase N-terminal domain-containing protein n=1 Tax=Dactylosporangium sp. CS-033363 TaxID=3239935 RepID=UPI003D906B29